MGRTDLCVYGCDVVQSDGTPGGGVSQYMLSLFFGGCCSKSNHPGRTKERRKSIKMCIMSPMSTGWQRQPVVCIHTRVGLLIEAGVARQVAASVIYLLVYLYETDLAGDESTRLRPLS